MQDTTGGWTAPAGLTQEAFLDFVQMPMDAIQPGDVATIKDYAQSWLADRTYNQPIRMDADTLTCELGQMRYSAAKAAWNALSAL
jgi:hypothetical protein